MKPLISRAALAATLIFSASSVHVMAADDLTAMVMTKTPGCACCSAWADIARAEGYEVETVETAGYVAMKRAHEVPDELWSCHSTRVGDYTIEGHVPMQAVRKLLTERPDIDGIAVPGMPAGSPGMGNDPAARFDVIAFGGAAVPGEVFYRAGH